MGDAANMADDDLVTCTLRCSPQTWDELRGIATGLDVSLSTVLNVLVHIGLKNYRADITDVIKRRKADGTARRYRRREDRRDE